MSFRKYGGINRSATSNIVHHQYSNESHLTISDYVGYLNSKTVMANHLDMSNNSIINVNTIYFTNGVALSPDQISQPNFECQNLTVTQTSTLNILNVSGVTTFSGTTTFLTNPFVTNPSLSPAANQLVTKSYIDSVSDYWSKTGDLIYPSTPLTNTLSIGSSTSNGSTLYVAGTLGVTSSATLGSTLNITGITNSSGIVNTGQISSTGQISALSTLSVSTNATVGGTLNITGITNSSGIVNTGQISSTGQISALSTLSVATNATVGGTLGITGITNSNGIVNTGEISSTGQISTLSALSVSGDATIGGSSITLSNIPNSIGDNVLTYNSTTKQVGFYGNSNYWTLNTINNNLYPNQTSYVVAIGKNSVTSGLALDVAGNTNIAGTFGVTSNATVGGTLNVTGLTNSSGIVNTGQISSTGQINALSSLDVGTDATISGNLQVIGSADINQNVVVSGYVSSTGALSTLSTLNVVGNATLGGSSITLPSIPNQNPSSTHLTYDTTTKKIGYYLDASGTTNTWTLTGTNLYPTNYATDVVAIGKTTVSTGYALDVSGNTNVSGSAVVAGGLTLQNTPNQNPTNTHLTYDTASGTVGYYLDTSGTTNNWTLTGTNLYPTNYATDVVAIGKATVGSGYALDVSGNANVSSALSVTNILNSSPGIAIGEGAGGINATNPQSQNSIAIGFDAGNDNQHTCAIAIGEGAGQYRQRHNSVAVGYQSGQYDQSLNSVAIGIESGFQNQGTNCVAIGAGSGRTNQSSNSTALGAGAGFLNQHDQTIIISGLGNLGSVNSSTTNAFYIAPVRNVIAPAPNATNYSLTYDTSTNEIYYSGSNWTLSDTTTTSSLLTTSSAAQALSFTSTSDYRIKENVIPISVKDSSELYKLNPVKYTNTLTGKQDYGFLAHEVQEIFPSIVTGEKDQEVGLQSINYTSLIPLLVGEIQELKAQVKELQMLALGK